MKILDTGVMMIAAAAIIIYVILSPIIVPIMWIKDKLFPTKVEFTDDIFIGLGATMQRIQVDSKGSIPNEFKFMYNIMIFKRLTETLNERINIHETYKNSGYCADVDDYKYILHGVELVKNELVLYKETIETMKYTIKHTSLLAICKYHCTEDYSIYFNEALKYYELWNKEGFDNIIYKYNKALKEIEMQAKKVSLNEDFK